VKDAPNLTFSRSSDGSIEVIVGHSTPVVFGVHEKIICASSDFFATAMSGHWKESKTRSITLKETDPAIFKIYVHWLYYQQLPVRSDQGGWVGNIEYLQLAKCYTLGDFLQDVDFKDSVLDAMKEKRSTVAKDGHNWLPFGQVIGHIYDNTVESSKARTLLVDMYVHHGHVFWLKGWSRVEDLPKQFLYDLSVALLEQRWKTSSDGFPLDSCHYHEHKPGKGVCGK
jgi:hypothetical protein